MVASSKPVLSNAAQLQRDTEMLLKPELLAKLPLAKKVVIKRVLAPEDDIEVSHHVKWFVKYLDAPTQSGKTRRVLDILAEHLEVMRGYGNCLILFVTQASMLSCVNQTMQRIKKHEKLSNHILSDHVLTTNTKIHHEKADTSDNMVLCGRWHTDSTNMMLSFVKTKGHCFTEVIVVIDECDQGGEGGVKERLRFLDAVQQAKKMIRIILVTATTANMSKIVHRLSKANLPFSVDSLSYGIIHKPIVYHEYVQPHDNYVSATWYRDTPGVWRDLVYPKKQNRMSPIDYMDLKDLAVVKALAKAPDASKKLSLICVTTSQDRQRNIALKLLKTTGFNVVVLLNSYNNNKNYTVYYKNEAGAIKSWHIPYEQIDKAANGGKLAKGKVGNSWKLVNTGINSEYDYTLPHVLCGALCMGTELEERVQSNSLPEEFAKLEMIQKCIMQFDVAMQRPDDYPEIPRIAVVGGSIASRGMTLQDPEVGFTYTLYCFDHTKDDNLQGANNTQRFGRASGALWQVYEKDEKPIVICSSHILACACSNQEMIAEKAKAFSSGVPLMLAERVTESEYSEKIKQMKKLVQTEDKVKDKGKTLDGVPLRLLHRWIDPSNKDIVAQMTQFLYHHEGPITPQQLKAGIGYKKDDKGFKSNIESGCSLNANNGHVWCATTEKIYMNPTIRKYLNKYLGSK